MSGAAGGLFDPARVVILILLLTAAEAAALAWLWRRRGRGVPPGKLIPNLLAGTSLLLAAYAALVGAASYWVLAALLAAGLCHLADLRARWR
ncbi:MAG: hypothetical protein NXI21_07175 [Alphaproteobacteria bacterium]|nr:hypothetical protein [Alphaproteobacteria bacterium]